MSRRIFLAALFDRDVAAELDALRSAVGVDDLERIPPHLTLMPPREIDDDGVDALWTRATEGAGRHGPIDLVLGPGATFAPRSKTIHLAVTGEVEALDRLRRDLRTGRPDRQPFTPHVTLRGRASTADIERHLVRLADVRIRARVRAVTLMERRQRRSAGPRWVAVERADLAGATSE